MGDLYTSPTLPVCPGSSRPVNSKLATIAKATSPTLTRYGRRRTRAAATGCIEYFKHHSVLVRMTLDPEDFGDWREVLAACPEWTSAHMDRLAWQEHRALARINRPTPKKKLRPRAPVKDELNDLSWCDAAPGLVDLLGGETDVEA